MNKQFRNTWWVAATFAAMVGCTAGKSLSSSSVFPGGGASGDGGESSAGAPSCDTPADHCLQPDDLLVSEEFKSGYVEAHVGKQTAPPNSSGEATFMILSDGSSKTSRVAYRSHRATPPEIAVGTLVAAPNVANNDGVYRSPTSRQEATEQSWFVARIVSVDPMSQGHVIVSGTYKVAVDALRVVEGDNGPRLSAPGAEDAMFVKPEHWAVAAAPLPTADYVEARLALAIQPPSAQTRNEGEFLITQSGERLWAKHAWRTRPATPADLKLGAHVIALDATDSGGLYRAPESRLQALQGDWFIAKITDTSESFKGVVTLAGKYRTHISALRVPLR